MALIKVINPDTKEIYEYYLDDKLKNQIDKKLIPALQKKDEDYVICIDGEERSGKSTFGLQIARYVDPTLNLNRVCFSPDEFKQAILGAKKGQCVIFDEAFRGFSSRGTLSEINRLLVSLMMEMGQRNLLVIVILPTFYLLEKYVALWRARSLFHILKSKGKKGYWRHYNKRKKRILYMSKGKQNYSYNPRITGVKSKFRGRFYGKYAVDEALYRKKKADSFKSGFKTPRQDKFKDQRDAMVYCVYRELSLTLRDLSEMLKNYNIRLKKDVLSDITNKFKK